MHCAAHARKKAPRRKQVPSKIPLSDSQPATLGHAPVIVPAVLGARIPFKERFYVHLALLHASVALRLPQWWLWMECRGGVHIPRQWRNQVGQLRMDAPYCHRDFRAPTFMDPRDEGIRETVVKRGDAFHGFTTKEALSGYAWLFLGGALGLAFGFVPAGPQYDAVLHALFVGFVFSMIFGHAPVIVPAVLGARIPFKERFYVHLALLHASVALRLAGDVFDLFVLRRLGAWGNAVAIVLFLVSTVAAALSVTTPERRRTDTRPEQAPSV